MEGTCSYPGDTRLLGTGLSWPGCPAVKRSHSPVALALLPAWSPIEAAESELSVLTLEDKLLHPVFLRLRFRLERRMVGSNGGAIGGGSVEVGGGKGELCRSSSWNGQWRVLNSRMGGSGGHQLEKKRKGSKLTNRNGQSYPKDWLLHSKNFLISKTALFGFQSQCWHISLLGEPSPATMQYNSLCSAMRVDLHSYAISLLSSPP